MEKKEILTEENYLKGKKKIKSIALIVLTIGLLLGGSLIITGIVKQNSVNEKYSEKNKAKELQQLESEKQQLSNQVEEEKQNLIKSKEDLEAKIKPIEDEIKSLDRVTFTGFDDAYYARKDKITELAFKKSPNASYSDSVNSTPLDNFSAYLSKALLLSFHAS